MEKHIKELEELIERLKDDILKNVVFLRVD